MRLAMDTIDELEWCLEQLETVQTHRSVSDMASLKVTLTTIRKLIKKVSSMSFEYTLYPHTHTLLSLFCVYWDLIQYRRQFIDFEINFSLFFSLSSSCSDLFSSYQFYSHLPPPHPTRHSF